MAKRILFFSLTYHPFIGGAEIAIKETTERISPENYRFDMITLRFDSDLPKFERVGNIDIFRIGFARPGAKINDLKKFPLVLMKYLYPFWAFAYAAVLHRRKPYDAVCSVMTSYASFAPLFFKYIFPGVKYVVRADDGDPTDYYLKRTRFISPLFRRIFTKADRAFTSSTYLERFIRSMGYTGEAVIVPNGVNTSHFSREYATEELDELKKKLGKKHGDIFLVTASRLVKKNATEDVIQALKFLPLHVKFLILGIGPDEEMLKKLSKDCGVEDRVFFSGQISHAELPKYLKASDIFIRPSLSEGFGISFIEAMVAGIPVIATQEGGIADFLYDPEKNSDVPPTGRAVKTHDPEGIALAVKKFIDNPKETGIIVANARKMASLRYDWSIIAKKMKEGVFDALWKGKS